MFSAEEIAAHLARIEHEQREAKRDQREIEREQRENDDNAQEEEAAIPESPIRKKARAQQFAMIKELLTAPVLGTS
jgi:septal ring factor EnvC (AmiA/AmiB activator)